MIINIRLIVGCIMLSGKAVRVVTIGQKADLNVHTFLQQHVDTADAGFDTCSVAVVKYSDVIGKPMNQSYLVGGQCRTR